MEKPPHVSGRCVSLFVNRCTSGLAANKDSDEVNRMVDFTMS